MIGRGRKSGLGGCGRPLSIQTAIFLAESLKTFHFTLFFLNICYATFASEERKGKKDLQTLSVQIFTTTKKDNPFILIIGMPTVKRRWRRI